MSINWQLQEAKNKLSHVIKQAREGTPQFITVHGEQAAVLLSIEDYRQLITPHNKLSDALCLYETDDSEAIFARSQDVGRDIDL